MKNTKISEWVSVGHPDRMADYIASKIISKIYEQDGKNAHAAIEIAVFDNKVIVGGEVTTTLSMTPDVLGPIIKECINKIGYNKQYRNKFVKDDCYVADDYEVLVFVNKQSPDIAMGTTDRANEEPGWNDQGTYVGYCSNELPTNGLSTAHFVATSFGEFLYKYAIQDKHLGLDIKTLVVHHNYTDSSLDEITNITVAIPTLLTKNENEQYVHNLFKLWAQQQQPAIQKLLKNVQLLINGTGAYKRHGSLGDSGVTGRKLVVNQCGNFAAGGSMIKPILASDRLLNLYARHVAKVIGETLNLKEVQVELSASIGQTYLGSIRILCPQVEQQMLNKLENYFLSVPVSPNILNQKWETLKRNNYDDAVFNNFFGSADYYVEPWEEVTTDEKNNLLNYLNP
jgi:S-adenosylmethionine synthetase